VLTHIKYHYKNKIHYCCVCGKAYFELERFAEHCCSHDDSEYIRIAKNEETKARLNYEVQIVEEPILASTFAEQLELASCRTIETVDNSTEEECIVCVENPIYV